MISIFVRLFISVVLLSFGSNRGYCSSLKDRVFKESINREVSNQSVEEDTASKIDFIKKKFNYYAPKSGSVNLLWSSENYLIDQAFSWNENTKKAYDLLYLPMESHGDTFSIELRVPKGAIIQYYFWISKNKQGLYQDFIDVQSSDKIAISEASTITKNAVYSKAKKRMVRE